MEQRSKKKIEVRQSGGLGSSTVERGIENPEKVVRFRSKTCSVRLSVRTLPFHGGKTGSIPVRSEKH